MAATTIGQLAHDLHVSVDTVRYYERRGLLPPPPRSAGGYRHYGDDDRWRLAFILRAKDLGFTLREIGELVEQVTDRTGDPAAAVRTAAVAKLDAVAQQQRELASVAERLGALVRLCDDGDAEACADLGTACGA